VTVRNSTPQVTLVDIQGNPASADDQGDAATWPAWTDNWHWEVEDDERAAIEAEAFEAECDRRDAPPEPWPTAEEMAEVEAEAGRHDAPRLDGEDLWRELMSAGHQASQVSDEELGQLAGHGCI
jgi:hypothetical protein